MSNVKKLDPTKRYTAFSPRGARIIGTNDTVPGTAHAREYYIGTDSALIPEYEGWTDVCWDAQEVVTVDGERTYVCEDGETWKESELVFEEVPNE